MRKCQRVACKQCRSDLDYLRGDSRRWDEEQRALNATIERIAFDHRAAHNAARIAQADIVKLERRIKRLKARKA